MKRDDYAHSEVRSIAVKANNIEHALLKTLVSIYNKSFKDNVEDFQSMGAFYLKDF